MFPIEGMLKTCPYVTTYFYGSLCISQTNLNDSLFPFLPSWWNIFFALVDKNNLLAQ